MIRVDKGLPMPGRSRAACKYPWHQMQPGDSFLVTTLDEACSATRAGRQFGVYHGITFQIARRAVAGGHRIWRTA